MSIDRVISARPDQKGARGCEVSAFPVAQSSSPSVARITHCLHQVLQLSPFHFSFLCLQAHRLSLKTPKVHHWLEISVQGQGTELGLCRSCGSVQKAVLSFIPCKANHPSWVSWQQDLHLPQAALQHQLPNKTGVSRGPENPLQIPLGLLQQLYRISYGQDYLCQPNLKDPSLRFPFFQQSEDSSF